MYGDCIHCVYLLNYFNIALMKNQDKYIKEYQHIITDYIPDVLDGEDYASLLEIYNSAFGSPIKKCYTVL